MPYVFMLVFAGLPVFFLEVEGKRALCKGKTLYYRRERQRQTERDRETGKSETDKSETDKSETDKSETDKSERDKERGKESNRE